MTPEVISGEIVRKNIFFCLTNSLPSFLGLCFRGFFLPCHLHSALDGKVA